MFKFKKSKIKIIAKPKEKRLNQATPGKFNKVSSIASLAIKKNKIKLNGLLKSSKKIDNLNLTQEAFLPKAKIRRKTNIKKEINFKPEVIFLNEFTEIFDGKTSKQKEDQNQTNLNGGNLRNVTLNQVSRLIDLHYTLKKHTISISNREIYRAFNIDTRSVIYIKRSIRSLLRRNFKELYDKNSLTFSSNVVARLRQDTRIQFVDKDFLQMMAINAVNQYIAKNIVKY